MIPTVGDAIGKRGKAARFIANKADDVLAVGRKIKCKVTGTGCFVAGTKVWLSATVDEFANQPHRVSDRLSPQHYGSSTATLAAPTRTIAKQAIETVAIGSRVSGDSPRPWDFDGELAVPDQSTWTLAKFSLQKEAGNWVDVEMIRPAEYWESQQAAPGSFIFMEFPELEASGMAQVRSIEPCPPIAEGSGNVVTARIVTRQVSELVEIGFDDDELLTGTPQHPIWSIERQDWVELGDLEIGEHLWTEDGPVEVQSKRLLTTAEKLYKKINRQWHYHEAWVDSETIGEHWGKVGEVGDHAKHKRDRNISVEKNLKRVLETATADGFAELKTDEWQILRIEYKIDGMGDSKALAKRQKLEKRLDDTLGRTGLGQVDGGSIGSGTMEVFCAVVSFRLAKQIIQPELTATMFGDYSRIVREV